MGCRVCKAGDLGLRSRAGLHPPDKVVLATRRFVYPLFLFTQREREIQELEVIEMKKNFCKSFSFEVHTYLHQH